MKLLVNLKKHAQQDDTKVLLIKQKCSTSSAGESKTNALVFFFWVDYLLT